MYNTLFGRNPVIINDLYIFSGHDEPVCEVVDKRRSFDVDPAVDASDQDPAEPSEGDEQRFPEEEGQIRVENEQGRNGNAGRRRQDAEEEVQTFHLRRIVFLVIFRRSFLLFLFRSVDWVGLVIMGNA